MDGVHTSHYVTVRRDLFTGLVANPATALPVATLAITETHPEVRMKVAEVNFVKRLSVTFNLSNLIWFRETDTLELWKIPCMYYISITFASIILFQYQCRMWFLKNNLDLAGSLKLFVLSVHSWWIWLVSSSKPCSLRAIMNAFRRFSFEILLELYSSNKSNMFKPNIHQRHFIILPSK